MRPSVLSNFCLYKYEDGLQDNLESFNYGFLDKKLNIILTINILKQNFFDTPLFLYFVAPVTHPHLCPVIKPSQTK